MRSRLRRARKLPEQLVVDIRDLGWGDKEWVTGLETASVLVVDAGCALDALAAGAPAVAPLGTSDALGLPEGLLREADEGSLFREAERLAADPPAASAAALTGRRHIEAEHDLDRLARLLVETLGDGPRRDPAGLVVEDVLRSLGAEDDPRARDRIAHAVAGVHGAREPEGTLVSAGSSRRARVKEHLRPLLQRSLLVRARGGP